MKHFKLILFTVLAAALFSMNLSAAQLPFKGGDKASYKIHYKWGVINADIAELNVSLKEETYNNVPCFRLQTSGGTSNFVKNLVKIKYSYDSRFSCDGLVPLYFEREQTEGDYWAKNVYTWNNQGRKLNAHVEKSTIGVKDTVMTANNIIYDVITVIYALRAADLESIKNGGSLHFVAALDRNISDVYVTYVKSEEKKSAEAGVFQTDKYRLKIVPHKNNEQLSNETGMAISNNDGKLAPVYLWLSADESKNLLFFSTSLAIGSVNCRIVSSN